jgi:xylan 1,4-beta-xylosidase
VVQYNDKAPALTKCLAVVFVNGCKEETMADEITITDIAKLSGVFEQETFHFEYALEDKTWRRIGPDFEAGKLSDDYCQELSFTGTFIALCYQDLSGRKKYADFNYFKYREGGREQNE